jgi:flagellar motor switch protein FliG
MKFTEQAGGIVQRAVKLCEKARREGLTALKESIDQEKVKHRDILEYGLLLFVNGVDSQRLNEILSNLVNLTKDEEQRHIKTLQKEAVLHIQKGHHPQLILYSLFSLLSNSETEETLGFITNPWLRDEYTKLLNKWEHNNKNQAPCVNVLDPDFLKMLLQEQPKTIANILAFIEPSKAAILLQFIPREIQYIVMYHIAAMDNSSSDVIRMGKKLSALFNIYCTVTGGIKKMIEILNLTDSATEKHIIKTMEDEDPEFAAYIKENLFVFEDIVILNDYAIQKVMREIETEELALALSGASKELQDRIFNNISKRAAIMLKEDIECLELEQEKLYKTNESQQKILSIIRHLEEIGEIIITRRNEDKQTEQE